MKSLRKFCLSITFLTGLFFSAGCATQNPAGRLLASTVQSVDAAMKGWATYVVAGHATIEQEAKVRKIYQEYKDAEGVAEVIVQFGEEGDETGWQRAKLGLLRCQRDLLSTIAQFSNSKP